MAYQSLQRFLSDDGNKNRLYGAEADYNTGFYSRKQEFLG